MFFKHLLLHLVCQRSANQSPYLAMIVFIPHKLTYVMSIYSHLFVYQYISGYYINDTSCYTPITQREKYVICPFNICLSGLRKIFLYYQFFIMVLLHNLMIYQAFRASQMLMQTIIGRSLIRQHIDFFCLLSYIIIMLHRQNA